jgi:transposase
MKRSEIVPVFVGLDYHDTVVQVCVLDAQGQGLLNRACGNDWGVIHEAVAGVAPGAPVYAAIEACTGAADLADELVEGAGWSVDLAHPGYVARIKQSPDKHDYGDARLLADLERVGYLPRVWLAPQAVRELRRLVRYRQQLANEVRNAKLRIRALLREHRLRGPGRAWTRLWLSWLKTNEDLPEQSQWLIEQHLSNIERLREAIRKVESRLEAVTAGDPLVERLLQEPGIGPVTAWTIRAEIGRFDRFRSGKQLARFCALSPRNASSGTRQADAGLIAAGNRQLRTVLIEAAHRLVRYHPRWSAFGASMRRRGKPGSVVAAAVANRWMRWLYHQMQPVSRVA